MIVVCGYEGQNEHDDEEKAEKDNAKIIQLIQSELFAICLVA